MRRSGGLFGLRLFLILEPALEHHHHVARHLRLVVEGYTLYARHHRDTVAPVEDFLVDHIFGVAVDVAATLSDVLTLGTERAHHPRLVIGLERADLFCVLDALHQLATDLLTHDAEARGATEAIDRRVGEDRLDRVCHGAEDAIQLVFDARLRRDRGRRWQRVIHY